MKIEKVQTFLRLCLFVKSPTEFVLDCLCLFVFGQLLDTNCIVATQTNLTTPLHNCVPAVYYLEKDETLVATTTKPTLKLAAVL